MEFPMTDLGWHQQFGAILWVVMASLRLPRPNMPTQVEELTLCSGDEHVLVSSIVLTDQVRYAVMMPSACRPRDKVGYSRLQPVAVGLAWALLFRPSLTVRPAFYYVDRPPAQWLHQSWPELVDLLFDSKCTWGKFNTRIRCTSTSR